MSSMYYVELRVDNHEENLTDCLEIEADDYAVESPVVGHVVYTFYLNKKKTATIPFDGVLFVIETDGESEEE